MNNRRINLYLVSTILVLSITSLLASYYLLDEILENSISVGVNQKTAELLTHYQQDLKSLRSLDPAKEEKYRQQFYSVQEAMVIYEDPKNLVKIIKQSYLYYYLVLFVGLLLVSIFAAYLLARKISLSYKLLFHSNIAKSKRLQELEHFDSWQQIAASLAHEIKNPLTPIEMMVSSLPEAHQKCTSDEFEVKLHSTKKIVMEEVERLKNMVEHFSQFSRLPEPVLQQHNFVDFLQQFISDYSVTQNKVELKLLMDKSIKSISLQLDGLLFKQCLFNLILNAKEANPNEDKLKIDLKVTLNNRNFVDFDFINYGLTISQEARNKLFQFGYTTKSTQLSHGIGLSIVKNIILKHHGDILSMPFSKGAAFKIRLPLESITHA